MLVGTVSAVTVTPGAGCSELVPAAGATTWKADVPSRSLSATGLREARAPSSAEVSRANARASGSKACSLSRPSAFRRGCGKQRPRPEADVRADVGHVDLATWRELERPALQGRLAVDRHVVRVVEARAEQDEARGADYGAPSKGTAGGIGSRRGDPAAGNSHGRHGMMLHRYVQC